MMSEPRAFTDWERIANEQIAANHDPVLRAAREVMDRLLIGAWGLVIVIGCWAVGLEVMP